METRDLEGRIVHQEANAKQQDVRSMKYRYTQRREGYVGRFKYRSELQSRTNGLLSLAEGRRPKLSRRVVQVKHAEKEDNES